MKFIYLDLRNYENNLDMKTKVLNIFYINYKDIPHKWGNFGKIPYGKTIQGRIFWSSKAANDNDFCDPSKTPNFVTYALSNEDYSPIFLVDS